MTHRRSGAQRRAFQKEKQRNAQQEAGAGESEAASLSGDAQAKKVAGQGCQARGKQQALQPHVQEVVAAVESLYSDELKPFGRLLRKRLAERHHASAIAIAPEHVETRLAEVDIRYLYALCADCEQFVVEPEEGGDWSVTLVWRKTNFVDFHSLIDVYSQELWTNAEEYFARDEDMTLPGGRYHCAQALLSRRLPFLEGYTLGQVCHIVQLSMSDKKLLGYHEGAVVPYSRSQSMIKEMCAVQQQPRSDACEEAASLPLADWDTARTCLRAMLAEA
jgi:hypothetical protein